MKSLNYVLNQNVNVTKKERFATSAVSIVDNLCSLQQEHKWNKIKMQLQRLIMNVPYGSNLMSILDFFISLWQNWLLSRGYFRCCRHALVAVAVVERWPLAGGFTKFFLCSAGLWCLRFRPFCNTEFFRPVYEKKVYVQQGFAREGRQDTLQKKIEWLRMPVLPVFT